MAENIYQALRPFLPEDTKGLEMGDDLRSIHFLPFPTAREEYLDPVIERQVQRMQSIIILGRALRDKHTLPIKVCTQIDAQVYSKLTGSSVQHRLL